MCRRPQQASVAVRVDLHTSWGKPETNSSGLGITIPDSWIFAIQQKALHWWPGCLSRIVKDLNCGWDAWFCLRKFLPAFHQEQCSSWLFGNLMIEKTEIPKAQKPLSLQLSNIGLPTTCSRKDRKAADRGSSKQLGLSIAWKALQREPSQTKDPVLRQEKKQTMQQKEKPLNCERNVQEK